ncbi:hypothetical protein RA280_07655 [Cupriavidus sp. CV2]|uniref:hypothetical protein n=1 Tax=Cupriavidus ulmosensis TaxID=3065913 RepID=UPI00296A9983|nr:hypothetical protein [Cupriavidus sp. CV2]MDW3681624.1 hypothetical protein [Cupriavidus sp. CV2]
MKITENRLHGQPGGDAHAFESKAEHTPGPWMAVWDHGTVERAHSICHIYPRSAAGERWPHEVATVHLAQPDTMEEANAHLIAAAPDMLALMRNMLAEYEDHPTIGISLWANDLRAVIAKAEGRA